MTAALLAAAARVARVRSADVPGRPGGDRVWWWWRSSWPSFVCRLHFLGAPEPAFLALGAGRAALREGRRLWRQRARARGRRARTRRPGAQVLRPARGRARRRPAGRGRRSTQAAEAWPAIGPVAQCQAYGGDVPAALRRAAQEPGAEGMALVAAAWHVVPPDRARPGRRPGPSGTGRCETPGHRPCGPGRARVPHGPPLGWWPPLPVVAPGDRRPAPGGDPLSFLLGTPIGLACLAGGVEPRGSPGSPGSNGWRPRALDDDRPGPLLPPRSSGWPIGPAGPPGWRRRRRDVRPPPAPTNVGPPTLALARPWRAWAPGPSSPGPPASRRPSSLRVSCGSCSAGPRPRRSGCVGSGSAPRCRTSWGCSRRRSAAALPPADALTLVCVAPFRGRPPTRWRPLPPRSRSGVDPVEAWRALETDPGAGAVRPDPGPVRPHR